MAMPVKPGGAGFGAAGSSHMWNGLLAVTATIGAMLIATAAPATADSYCGQSSRGTYVYAGTSATSCAFALNTAEAYAAYGNGSHPFTVSSPVTGQAYTMTCTVAGSICQGGNGAVVYLRAAP